MAQSPNDDQELLRQLAKGNQAAFNACYERYQGALYHFAWHMSGNQANAEEVTQEVFLRLIDNPKGYDPAKGSLAGYLFGIARNVVRRQMQSSWLDEPLEEEIIDADDAAMTAESSILWELNRQEKLEQLHKSVLGLPALYREALVLCDLQEMSHSEAAVLLNCPAGTVASRIHRARAMLKVRLQKMGCVR